MSKRDDRTDGRSNQDHPSYLPELSKDPKHLEALKDILIAHTHNNALTEEIIDEIVRALDRYTRERRVDADQIERKKTKSKKLLQAALKLQSELVSDEDTVKEVWRQSAAPNSPADLEIAAGVYMDRWEQVKIWNYDIGSPLQFEMKLDRIIAGLNQTIKELSPRGRPVDIPKRSLGVVLAMVWGRATRTNPTFSGAGDFENPGTSFGWFAKRAVELLRQHEEFETGFSGFLQGALVLIDPEWWVKYPEES